jgi:hypothetical protein
MPDLTGQVPGSSSAAPAYAGCDICTVHPLIPGIGKLGGLWHPSVHASTR